MRNVSLFALLAKMDVRDRDRGPRTSLVDGLSRSGLCALGLLSVLLFALPARSLAQTVFWQDNFENATTPDIAAGSTRTPENNSGSGGPPNTSYFKRTDGTDISMASGGYTLQTNTFFWAGEDHDTPFGVGNEEQQIEWTNINITGQTNLTFKGFFGANSANGSWDNFTTGSAASGYGIFASPAASNDYVVVEYAIDAGAYTKLIHFFGDDITGPVGSAKRLKEDTNGDFIGDGTVLTTAMTEFTKTIPGTGTTMKIRIRSYSNGGSEEWGIDNFRMLGSPPCTAPTITCPAAQTLALNASCQGTLPDYTGLATVTGNCTPVTTQSPTAGTTVTGAGAATVTLTVTNSNSQTATCNFTVNKTDAVLPSITCPANQTVNTSVGACTATVTYTAPVGTDNCTGPTTVRTAGQASGTAFPKGPTTVTYQVTDGSGNTATCSFTVTVNDNQNPTITCPANVSVNAAVGTCSATATYTAPVGTDNCTGATTARTAGLASGSTFPVGVNTVTYQVTDAAALTGTCSFTVTVVDNQLPTITCPANQSLPAAVGTCAATATYTAPVGADNCSGSTTTLFSGGASGSSFSGGVNTVQYRVTDASGNTASCTFTITVTDNQLPAITCPANVTVNTTLNQCTGVATYTAPIGTDNCPGQNTVRTAGGASGSAFVKGPTTVTFQVTDGSGNTASCSFTVTVNDNQAPAITCPANQNVNVAVGTCAATATYTAPVGTDNCTGATTSRTAGQASGSSFSLGVNPITYQVTDASGNTTSCTFNITVIDNQLPTITCPANQSLPAAVGTCAATATYTAPVGTDNCVGASTTRASGLASGSSFSGGVNTVVYQVTDGSGNTSTCSFTITVTDNQVPSITCPASFTAPTDLNQCTAVIPYPTPTGTDNCPGATTNRTTGLATGAAFPLGSTTCTFVVTDGSGNTASCAFTATITDNQTPTITCPANITANTASGQCTAVVTYTAPSTSDNCSGAILSQTAGLSSGSTFPRGTTTNTFRITDGSGNSSTCSFTVTVNDNQAPAVTCQANVTRNVDPGQCGSVFTFTAPTPTDNCTGATVSQSQGLGSGALFPVGANIVRFTATDVAGNTSTCQFTVTVVDNILPTITCPANRNFNTAPGSCDTIGTYTSPVGTDNCAGSTTVRTSGLASGSTFPLGLSPVVFRVTDASGNTATCAFLVIVSDGQPPVITCPANQSVNSGPGQCTATATYTTPTASDNCGGPSVFQIGGLASGATYPLGVTTNTYQASDNVGNSATCSFTISVSDALPPTWASCPSNQNLTAGSSVCNAIASWTVPTASDNCGSATTTTTHTPGSIFPVGVTQVIYTATDGGGNTATCSFNVTVVDNVHPVALCHGVTLTLDSQGNATTNAAAINNGSSDNCSVASTSISQTAFTCANVGANTVTLLVTDASGNTTTCTATVTVQAPAVTGTAVADTMQCGYNVSCHGGTDGVAHASGGGGCPGYTYHWSNNQNTATATGLAAGTHSVTITDASGGTHVATVTLTEPSAIQVGVVTTQSCPGDSTGTVNISPSGGNDCQGYTFLWSNGATTEDLTGLAPGSYLVTVTDVNGCTGTQTATVGTFPAPTPTFTVSGLTLTSGQTYTSYQWLLNGSNIVGANSNSYVVTQTGSYSLFVTDANGCVGLSDTTHVTVVGVDGSLGSWADMGIYPNPARDEFRLHAGSAIGEAVTVRIHDLYGRLLSKRVFAGLSGDVVFDIASYSAGTYFVEVAADSGARRLFKLVVE